MIGENPEAADAGGSVEVGCAVAAADRSRGYAVEAPTGMLDCARQHSAWRCIAFVRPDNAASQAVVRHFPVGA